MLENRLIKEWRPTGNKALKRTDQWAFVRCRLDIEYPVLDAAPDPAPGHAINVGPIKGLRTAQDIADTVCFLASDDSSFVTGAELLVDGGITAAYVTPEP